MKSKQKFLLIAPWDYQLYVVIEKNLRYLGYDVTVVHNNHYPFSPTDIVFKLKYLSENIFSKDYKQHFNNTYSEKARLSLLQSHNYYDICLVIRADVFSKDLLIEAKKRSRKFISFFYDGLTFNQHVLQLIPFFDRFYIFDKTELPTFKKYGIHYAPNFYFDYPELNENTYNNENKIYYISSFNPCRVDTISSFYKFISQRLSPIQFDIVYNETNEDMVPEYMKQHFNCIETIVPYETQLKLIRNTEIILDIKMAIHSGFSFRIFDGIKLRKKVITTNPYIINEDFYHPNNFFILTKSNESELDNFLKQPYAPLDEQIRTKYSFENWLKAVTSY